MYKTVCLFHHVAAHFRIFLIIYIIAGLRHQHAVFILTARLLPFLRRTADQKLVPIGKISPVQFQQFFLCLSFFRFCAGIKPADDIHARKIFFHIGVNVGPHFGRKTVSFPLSKVVDHNHPRDLKQFLMRTEHPVAQKHTCGLASLCFFHKSFCKCNYIIFYINFTSSLYIPYLPHTFWCFPIHDKTSLSLHVTFIIRNIPFLFCHKLSFGKKPFVLLRHIAFFFSYFLFYPARSAA